MYLHIWKNGYVIPGDIAYIRIVCNKIVLDFYK